MISDSNRLNAVFCDDTALGYERSRTRFAADQPLLLDAAYRLAHLPLVNPAHPDVIASAEGRDYAMGLHGPVHSLVIPIPQQQLDESPAYQALLSDVRQAVFSRKIAWDIAEKRRGLLHATVCGSLGRENTPPVLGNDLQSRLRALGPIQVELRGLFSGNVNVGRLYLKAYPAKQGQTQAFHQMQQIIGRSTTDLYLVGLFNLTDHLDAVEAQALAQLIKDCGC
jgi:hypothetical protein